MPLVEVTLTQGRSPTQLRSLIHELHEAVVRAVEAPSSSVRVIVREVPPPVIRDCSSAVQDDEPQIWEVQVRGLIARRQSGLLDHLFIASSTRAAATFVMCPWRTSSDSP
jgi:4-oxalocrotonate tautomerase